MRQPMNCFIIVGMICLGFLFSACPSDSGPEPDPATLIADIDTEIYYYSKRSGVHNIYKMDADGVEHPIVVDNGHHNWWVRVSPNKDKLLWYRSPLGVAANKEYNNYEEAELWMADIDGSNPHKVIDLTDNDWTGQGVADWSPDGSQLVMAAIDTSGHWHLFTSDSEGKNLNRITQRNSLYIDSSWSSDGQQIVCTAFPEDYTGNAFSLLLGTPLEIHIMDKDGQNETRLTNDDLRDHDPYWSPDGKEIAFETHLGGLDCFVGRWSIRKYSFDTETTTDILKDGSANGIPRWSQDSNELYFARKECNKYAQLFRMDRNGDGLETVIQGHNLPVFDCDLVW